MGWKCTPQVIGLVRGNPKAGQKHRANGLKILQEGGNERFSKSETLDRTRSTMNRYEGYASGKQAWQAMCIDADAYRTVGKTKDGKPYERALRSDAVIGWSVIFNPPSDVCADWDDQDYERFYADSFAALCEIEPRLFRDENVVQSSEHFDEGLPNEYGEFGRHIHRNGFAKDADGKYCGNLIDAKLCNRINEMYPRLMRARGWDMDDLDTTDWERYKDDPKYRAERKAKRSQSGKSTNKYIADTAMATAAKYQQADEELLEVGRIKHGAKQDRNAARMIREQAQKDAESLVTNAKEQAARIIADAQRDAQRLSGDLAKALEDAKAEKEKYRQKSVYAQNLIKWAQITRLPARAETILDAFRRSTTTGKRGRIAAVDDFLEQIAQDRDFGDE